ncbi:MAG: hypothetical protein KA144_03795 [Xanthomonadaceae bacterium]|nr:hypothetical protein [Xanthomonadaceae bacterium]
MTLDRVPDAQRDMRHGYFGGAPGVAASALAWCAAGVVAIALSPKHAVLALFVGGMFIHPVGILIAKALGRPGSHTRGNPLGTLALESTVLMLLCLPLAYAISIDRIAWFFPAMLLVIGGRYLIFHTIYGARIYLALGACLAAAAFALVTARAAPVVGAFAGGAIESIFAAAIFLSWRRDVQAPIERVI